MKPLLLLLLLAACSTNPKPPTKPINAVVHLNEESSPCGKLTRYDGCYAIVTGIEGMAGMGFPRWVYAYYLP